MAKRTACDLSLASPRAESCSVSSQDIIIAVMGATGVGKSSFISKAIGNDRATIGHDLRSCTQKIQAVRCRHPDNPDRNIVFLDTPGFDDTSKTDTEVLVDIAEWLRTTYERGILLTGLLFLHRISDNRMAGTSRRNTEMFEMLCGCDALQNVILVTTMWDTVDELVGSVREKELGTLFWESMLTSGSRMMRFDHTYQSAWEILEQFTGAHRPLQLQVEMVDEGKPLARTAAGSALFRWLDQLITQFRAMIAAFQAQLRNVSKRSEMAEKLIDGRSAVVRDLKLADKQKKLLANQQPTRPRYSFADTVRMVMAQSKTSPSSTSLPNTGMSQSISIPSHTVHSVSKSSTSPPNISSLSAPHSDDDHHAGFGNRSRDILAGSTTLLRHARDIADMAPVPVLGGVMSMALTVAQSIEAMQRTENSLNTLAKNARLFSNVVSGHLRLGNVSDDMTQALQDLFKELEAVRIVLDKMKTLGRLHRYVLQPADEQVFLACSESFHTACELFGLRSMIMLHQAIGEIKNRLPPAADVTPRLNDIGGYNSFCS